MVRLRQARTPADIAVALRLQHQLFRSDAPERPEDGNVFWVAWDGETPVGFCSVRKVKAEAAVFLSRSGVVTDRRGDGLQRRMIRVRLGWARAQGHPWAITYASPANGPSIVNLLKAGFRVYAPRDQWAGPMVYFRRQV